MKKKEMSIAEIILKKELEKNEKKEQYKQQ